MSPESYPVLSFQDLLCCWLRYEGLPSPRRRPWYLFRSLVSHNCCSHRSSCCYHRSLNSYQRGTYDDDFYTSLLELLPAVTHAYPPTGGRMTSVPNHSVQSNSPLPQCSKYNKWEDTTQCCIPSSSRKSTSVCLEFHRAGLRG